MRRKKTSNGPLLVVMIILLVAIASLGGISFSKYYGEYGKGDDKTSHIAEPIAVLENKAIYRTDSSGNREIVDFDKSSDTVTVKDVEPQDVIDYYFTVTDKDGKSYNEVLMKVTLSLTVRLEMILESGVKSTVYFAGWESYDEDDGIKNGGELKIYGVIGGDESQIRKPQSGGDGVDYSGYTLYVAEEDGATVNKVGFYISPYGVSAKEYTYHISFTLPKQSEETERYAGARLYFDTEMLAEQERT